MHAGGKVHRAIRPRAGQHVSLAHEVGDEQRMRIEIDVLGRADLLDAALVHDDDAGGERKRFGLVVGDEDEGAADLRMDAAQLLLHRMAQLEIEGGQRLVQQQHLGPHDERARERDPLLLPAGQAIDHAVAEPVQPHQPQRLRHPGRDLRPRHLPQREAEADILRDAQMREQAIALEHHVGGALLRAERR